MADEMRRRTVGVHVVKASKNQTKTQTTRLLTDPFENIYETNGLIEPPYTPGDLAEIPENNNVLHPLIDAIKTNVVGFGYSFRYRVDINSDETPEALKKQAKEEWTRLENFYRNCSYSEDLTYILQDMLDDRERIGYGALEVVQSAKGEPIAINHIPAQTLRLSKYHPDIQEIKIDVIDVDGKKTTIRHQKRFRKFCQKLDTDNSSIWFKEFGDPRKMDYRTGTFDEEYDNEGKLVKTNIPPEYEASSIIYYPIKVPYTPYGLPRWMGNLMSIQGSRLSEELNYKYFTNGKHIPLAILVNNGMLTESSIDKLTEYADQITGVDNAHGFLILEAEGFTDGDDLEGDTKASKVEIKMEKLTEALQQDELFQNYDSNNRDKIRAAYRLPPIYTGESKDYTRATADVAIGIAEEQIFQPERRRLADRLNRLVNPLLGVQLVELYFKSPDITNKKDLAEAVNYYNKTGALTPNMLIQAVSDLLGTEFEPFDPEWGDIPMTLTIEKIRAGASNNKKSSSTEDNNKGSTPTTEPEGGELNE